MVRGNYDGWGYSPLDQITTANVKELVPVWSLSTGVSDAHQAPPIVNNGMMFVSTPQNHVIAIDAKTGNILWRYRARAAAETAAAASDQSRRRPRTATRSNVATHGCLRRGAQGRHRRGVWDKCVARLERGLLLDPRAAGAKGKS